MTAPGTAGGAGGWDGHDGGRVFESVELDESMSW